MVLSTPLVYKKNLKIFIPQTDLTRNLHNISPTLLSSSDYIKRYTLCSNLIYRFFFIKRNIKKKIFPQMSHKSLVITFTKKKV